MGSRFIVGPNVCDRPGPNVCDYLGPAVAVGGATPAACNVGNYRGTGEKMYPFYLRLTHGEVEICSWGSFGARSCIVVSSFLLPSPKIEEN